MNATVDSVEPCIAGYTWRHTATDGIAEIEGEAYCYLVQSQSEPEIAFRVELTSLEANGWCGCWDFEFRRHPALTEGTEMGEETRCKHIRRIRDVLMDAHLRGHLKVETPTRFKAPGRFRFIKAISQQRQVEMIEYLKLKAIFLRVNPACAVKPGREADDVHHLRGRSGSLLRDTRYWLPVSRAAHVWIDANRAEARAKGWLCEKGDWLRVDEDEQMTCACGAEFTASRSFMVGGDFFCPQCATKGCHR